jgi:hypothetical protein
MKVAHALASPEQTSISQHGDMNISGDGSMVFKMQDSLLEK